VKLWEFVLRADQRHDLSIPPVALGWLHTLPWGYPGQWADRTGATFARNVLALRSLARRLKGKHLRRPAPVGEDFDLAADRILFHYLGMLNLRLMGGPGGVLSAKGFRGLKPWPTFTLTEPMKQDTEGKNVIHRSPVPIELSTETDRIGPQVQLFFWNLGTDAEVFWQWLFYSLVGEDSPTYCQGCGGWLNDGTTKTGRPSKQRLCSTCRHRQWKGNQTKSTLRKMWRRLSRSRSKKGP
jgi:hypothetical protein